MLAYYFNNYYNYNYNQMRALYKILILVVFAGGCSTRTQVKVTNLKCENKVNPLGIDVEKPRFSWISESDQHGVSQSAYQIMVASSWKNLEENSADVWESPKVSSDKSIQIGYEGKPLESNRKYFWKVKIWDQAGQPHSSEPAFWSSGLLHGSDWTKP